MAPRPEKCPQCGTPSPAEGRFCGGCGFDLDSAPEPAAPAPASSPEPATSQKRTVMGMMAFPEMVPGAPPPAEPDTAPAGPPAARAPETSSTEAPAPDVKRTMMGMMAPMQPPPPAAPPVVEPAPTPAAAQVPSAANRPAQPTPSRGRARTMMGLTSPLAAPASPTAPTPAQASDRGQVAAAGGFSPVASVDADEPPTTRREPSPIAEPAEPPTAAVPAAAPADVPIPQVKVPDPQTQRTMLGMNLAPPPGPPQDSGLAYGGAPSGQPAQAPVPAPQAPMHAYVPPVTTSEPPLPKKRGGGGLVLGVAVFLLLGGLGAAAWFFLADHGEALMAEVVRVEEGEFLEIRFAEGSDAREVVMGETRVTVEAGRARLPLAADALSVGTNRFEFEVLGEGEARDTHQVEVVLRYRLEPDLAGLDATPPVFRVRVAAPVGTTVQVDGAAVTLDAEGEGVWEQPIPVPQLAAQEGPLARQIPYRVEFAAAEDAPGPEEGSITLSVPRVPLALAQPGLRPVTDQERLELVTEVSGVDAPALTLDGTSLTPMPPSPDGPRRFRGELGLELGERSFVVEARAPGHAPTRLTIEARRVADLAAEAESYGAEAIPYPELVAQLDARRGARVSYVARVYNVGAQGDPRAFQVLVRDCPGPEACPLWLDVVAAQTPHEGDWVRVIGEVSGSQSFRTESGEALTVPRLSARYLLPDAR